MRQLLPTTEGALDLEGAYGADSRLGPPQRPWVMANMIASVDGATALDGVSRGLGGPADKTVFATIRSLADVILVAAGTVRSENYGPPNPSEDCRTKRVARGQRERPRLAIVTASLDLDYHSPLFRDAVEPPVIFTTTSADPQRRGHAGEVAEVVAVGADRVDLVEALRWLKSNDSASIVLCEGGPSLIGALVAENLVDELCLTLSPMLIGGDSARVAHGPWPVHPESMVCHRVLEEDGFLFLRYVRV